MRAVILTLLALCFASVSALASYEPAETGGPVMLLQDTFSSAHELPVQPKAIDRDQQQESAQKGDECPCKQTQNPLTLTCGVTLALSDDDESERQPVVRSARYALERSDRYAQMTYRLIRPPRTVL